MDEKTKTDRRVIRTKAALHQALLEIVREKGYASTSVEDITRRANLGRATFYLHYKDKEGLLLDGLEPRLNALIELVGTQPLVVLFKEQKGNLISSIFDIVMENSEIFTMITMEQSNKVFDRFRTLMSDTAKKLIRDNPWVAKKVEGLILPLDYLVDYFSGAIWASIVWWAGGNYRITTEEMTNMFISLFIPGLLRTLSAEDFDELMGLFS